MTNDRSHRNEISIGLLTAIAFGLGTLSLTAAHAEEARPLIASISKEFMPMATIMTSQLPNRREILKASLGGALAAAGGAFVHEARAQQAFRASTVRQHQKTDCRWFNASCTTCRAHNSS